MLKYLGFLIAGLYAIPSFAVDCKAECDANQYSAGQCQVGGMLPVRGHLCQSCPSDFPYSAGGTDGIDACFHSQFCTGQNWNCMLYHGGDTWCVYQGAQRPYHIEKIGNGFQCVPNDPKNCSEFDLSPAITGINSNFGNGTYDNASQTGTATWDAPTYTWDVSGCRLIKDGFGITSDSRNCHGTVWRTGALNGNAATGFTIDYSSGREFYYCKECFAGTKPKYLPAGDEAFSAYSCWYDGVGENAYLACMCEDVDAEYYSIGCQLENYPLLAEPPIPADCHIQCPAGTTTDGDTGATSASQCTPDGNTPYCDRIGCFKLKTDPINCN